MLENALNEPVRVSQQVLDGITDIRDLGVINMFDYHGVLELAKNLEHHEAYEWLSNNKGLYAKGIFAGFSADEPISDVLN